MDTKLYLLDIDKLITNLSLFTIHDIGGEGRGIIVEEDSLYEAIHEIVNNFESLLEDSFEPYEEEEEEE